MAADFVLGAVWYPPPPWEPEGWPHASRWTWAHWEHWLRVAGWSDAKIALYKELRDYYGIRVRDAKTGEERFVYRPNPIQVLGHQATEPFLLLGGARGGSKSEWLMREGTKRCLATPGTQAILFRRLLEELKLHHIKRLRRGLDLLTNGKGRLVGDDFVDWGNGSILQFGHAKDVGDEVKYLGSEWDLILIDQIEQWLPSQLVDIFAAGRSAEIAGMTSVVRATANPGGPDPQWIIDRWITKDVRGDEGIAYRPEEWRYIAARVYDNPFLMDRDGSFKTYEGRLAAYGPIRRRQMLLGDWGAREGQFFPELLEHHHKRSVDVPGDARLYAGLDFGYNKPGAVVFCAMTRDGRLVVLGDIKFTQTPLFASAQAKGESTAEFRARSEKTVAGQIVKWCRERGRTLHTLACDPDLDKHKTGVETGIAGLRRAGLPAMAADNARYLGWLRLRAWWQDAPDGLPWCVISPEARYTWRSLTTIVCDDSDPDDANSEGDDHGADALRYIAMAMPAPASAVSFAADHPRGSVGALIKQTQRQRGRKVARIL
jgi:hypothetical protein